ncbi:trans-2-enoyl-CoA reductase family protein [Candidatus Poribacteria bacterium]|nr:trans-2-enoyl-CoA reductase family protein [Candidatus Poribacteria bacterium]MYH80160.1 trans-2-enoyl-CoA reductase family protein [Candidatus Poribacteria bacterium]MYK94599.1 trans-2-enoyl-CoA reductase family protein [Candidatus Poribacteria bacterium]
MAVQIVKPRIRGFICTNAHPAGCHANVLNQIDEIKQGIPYRTTDLNALVIGASTGYGLASRIALTWAYGAKTLGLLYERPADDRRTASAGYYNTAAFHQQAAADGFLAQSLNGDAFSNEMKTETIDRLKADFGKIDVLVYSIAAPRRIHPDTGASHESVLKPIGAPYTGKTIDLSREVVAPVTIEPANEQEITDTIAVMGGEDLEMWVDALADAELLAPEMTVVAYTYIGSALTWPIYRDGTIGRAKDDLKARVDALDQRLADQLGGNAYISVNKAVVTQASAAIPVVPLYISILYDIMDAKGVNEAPIGQMRRLFSEHLGPGLQPQLDSERYIRLDDRELQPEITNAVTERWGQIDTDNFHELSDYAGYRRRFRNLFGFEVEDVDYDEAVETELVF